ncbi:MAG: hypothetical protein ACE5Z5_01535 [Candidatus Bathyarchaeia archaeon]
MGRIELDASTLRKICQALIKRDPEIVEVVQFGSSVYAPQHAKDLDLMVFTRKRKGYMFTSRRWQTSTIGSAYPST